MGVGDVRARVGNKARSSASVEWMLSTTGQMFVILHVLPASPIEITTFFPRRP